MRILSFVIRPSASASWIMRRAARSFTLPPGFANSSFAQTSTSGTCSTTRRSRTSGVLPTASRTDSMRRRTRGMLKSVLPAGPARSSPAMAARSARRARIAAARMRAPRDREGQATWSTHRGSIPRPRRERRGRCRAHDDQHGLLARSGGRRRRPRGTGPRRRPRVRSRRRDYGARDAGLPREPDLGQLRLAGMAIHRAAQPPAIAGTMLIWSPALSVVRRPSRKRTSSSPT